MAFKPQGDGQESMNEINVTPLVDVMLVLVIILLVTAPVLTQSVNVKLPEAAANMDSKDEPLQLAIDATGQISLNKQVIPDLVTLEVELKVAVQQNPEVAVQLLADNQVMYAKVAEVMAITHHAGISKLAFVANDAS